MRFFVDFIYLLLALVLSLPLSYKLATRRKYRAGFFRRLGFEARREGHRPCIWVHGVSVGEVIASKALIAAIKRDYPDVDLVISSTTSTGNKVARKLFPDDRVIFFPLDFSFAVRRTFRAIRPDLIILVELEIWPNFLDAAYSDNIPIMLVNGRISERSFRGYKLIRWILFRPLSRIVCFCVQTEAYAERFRRLGIPEAAITITGNMKHDNALDGSPERIAADMRAALGFGADEPVLIAGSTHHPEERELAQMFVRLRQRFPTLRLILVPRHPERAAEVEAHLTELELPVTRRTAMQEQGATLSPDGVLLVDTVGELARLYTLGTVVFVGGSLVPHGGQNMLEPASLGKPVLFGPHTFNFTATVELFEAHEAALAVADVKELEEQVARLLEDPALRQAMGERARIAVALDTGATGRTHAILRQLIETRHILQNPALPAPAEVEPSIPPASAPS